MKYIRAIVTANSKKDTIKKGDKDDYIITVKDRAERNMANKKVIELLASNLSVLPNKIRIINGHHHPHKLLVIEE